MPPVKPSEKTGHEGEWWRKDHGNREENEVDPNYEREIDEAEVNQNMRYESQEPLAHPSSG